MNDSHWVIKSAIRRIALRARGPATSLAKGLLDLIPQFMTLGMHERIALRESLLITIRSAQLRARNCVGTERYALDDFINTCVALETEYLQET